MASVLIRRGNLETNMHTEITSCEDEGGFWSCASISLGAAKLASKPSEARKYA